jgi:hypothetical protein
MQQDYHGCVTLVWTAGRDEVKIWARMDQEGRRYCSLLIFCGNEGVMRGYSIRWVAAGMAKEEVLYVSKPVLLDGVSVTQRMRPITSE